MRYTADLITEVERDTGNPASSSTSGIQLDDYLRYMNWAQERMQALILSCKATIFRAEKVLSIVANQEAYTISDHLYLGERMVKLEFSHDSTVRNYRRVPERTISDRYPTPGGYPSAYIRAAGGFLLIPPSSVSSGSLRATYERQLDKLDIRRGTITASTINGSNQITALSINTASDDATALAAALISNPYICISDADGNVTAYNIPFSNYNSGTGAFTISGGAFTLQTGEAAAVGSFITIGKYSTTHSKLKDECERYLQAYAAVKIFGRDAATKEKRDVFETELALIESEIKQSYEQASHDEEEIYISDPELML